MRRPFLLSLALAGCSSQAGSPDASMDASDGAAPCPRWVADSGAGVQCVPRDQALYGGVCGTLHSDGLCPSGTMDVSVPASTGMAAYRLCVTLCSQPSDCLQGMVCGTANVPSGCAAPSTCTP